MTTARGSFRPAAVGLVRLGRALVPGLATPAFRWTDAHGTLTEGELLALTHDRPDPEVVCEDEPRLLASRLLAGIIDHRRLYVVSPRAGSRTLAAAKARAARDAEVGRRANTGRLVPRLVFATSGSTGDAKLVRHRPSALVVPQLLGILGRLPDLRRPVVACLAPLDHGHGAAAFAWCRLLGGRFIFLDAAGAVSLLAAGPRVDLLTGVPVQLAELCDAVEAAGARVRVANVLSGSDRLDPALASRLERVLGAAVGNAYGSTETLTVCLATPADRRIDPTTVGRPLPGCIIADAPGGRLSVTAPSLRDPFVADLGWVGADGLVRVTGRADGVRVSGGENISMDAVASWLRGWPGITDAHWRDEPDARFGRRPVVRVKLAMGARLTEAQVREGVRDQFGAAAVPAHVEFTG